MNLVAAIGAQAAFARRGRPQGTRIETPRARGASRRGVRRYSGAIDAPSPEQFAMARAHIAATAEAYRVSLDWLLCRDKTGQTRADVYRRAKIRNGLIIDLYRRDFSAGEIAELLRLPYTQHVLQVVRDWEASQGEQS